MTENQSQSFASYLNRPMFLRLPEVAALTTMGESTILAWEVSGKFPKAVRISPGKRVWRTSDVEQWVNGLGEGGMI